MSASLTPVLEALSAPGVRSVGLTGGVAAGKSTLARTLAEGLAARGRRVGIVSTDGFLLPNALLAERGLLGRKGFPESYDLPLWQAFLAALRSGGPLWVPVYSHRTYDRLPDERTALSGVDVVLIEGLIALQPDFSAGALDIGLYVDAPEETLFSWYRQRLIGLREAARTDPDSYFVRFLALTEAQWEERIAHIWESVNLPNLRQHVAPTRPLAHWVLEKAPDHTIAHVLRQ